MKIALYTTNRTTIPPKKNIIAASAQLTALLADGLVDKGHDVTLYAPKGSVSKAKIIDLDLEPTNLDFSLTKNEITLKLSMGMKQIFLSEIYKNANNFDIIHLQTEPIYLGMPFARFSNTPTLFTNHNIFSKAEEEILTFYKSLPIISISNNQKSFLPGLNYVKTIYDGIDIDYYSFESEVNFGPLCFMGRLVKQKGIIEAIKAAQASNKSLNILGVGEESFMKENVEPLLSEQIKLIDINDNSVNRVKTYQGSRATIFPIIWEEPFGLVMVESMATGTPVIAFANGSVPEIIKDGETGFIVNSSNNDIRGNWIIKKTGIEGLTEAINMIYSQSDNEYLTMRQNCRKQVEKNFSSSIMIEKYENLYKSFL